ncbi:MAG: trypsin-like peptidase domain-containing protein [Caldilineaceae bacterium]|nr:trypsin-like peptidase domain-containing protein [Caldilineaceae bacterium]
MPSAQPATMVGGWTPPATAVVPRLVVRTGRDDGKELALVEGREVMIGRDAASEFALTDARVSSRHARVRLDGEHLLVEDLGSANGTIVDGKRITGSEYAGESSEIQVGETVIVFTRQPSSFYASSPSPTLVGAAIPQIDQRAVAEAVEHAVEARERQDRPKTLMYTAIGGVVAIAIGVGLAAFFLRPTSDGSLKESDIVDREKFATLRIDAYDPNGDIFSGGSGSIIDLDKGFVLTNNHVASVGALKVFSEITKDSIDAELVAAAPCDDLALVRVPGLKDAVEGLRQVTFGDIAALKQGERVTALGYPGAAEGFLGRSLSATTGVVSKVKTVYDQPGSGLPFLINVIQTDAAINPGNSGGPLLNLNGEVIGVNFAIRSEVRANSGVGFAIPVSVVHRVVPALIDQGYFNYPYLGIAGSTINPIIAERQELPEGMLGVFVSQIAGTPARNAGIEENDIILGIDDVEVRSFEDLIGYLITSTEPGQDVNLRVYRDGEEQIIELTVGERPR